MLKLRRNLWAASMLMFLALLGFFGGWIAGESQSSAEETAVIDDTYESMQTLIQAMSLIKNNYVDETKVKQKELVYGAIKGIVSALDPYSQFMDPRTYKDMMEDTQGSFGGLGIEIAIRDNQLIIISPIDGTPASRASIQPGDQILKINSEYAEGLTIMDAVHRMRGVPGTKCTLTLQRKGLEDFFDVTLIRDVIKIKSIRYDMLEDQIGYIRITQFMEHTGEDFARAMSDLQGRGMKGLILDLRNNPGGLLNMAAEIAEYFVPQGKLLVYTEGRNPSQNMKFFSTAKRPYNNGPLAVLINQGSASASEIVSGAIQDWNLGVIVGEKTFGKGSVQTIIPMNDGSALRITTARYLTPKGRLIHGNGVTPDMNVEAFRPNDYTMQLIQNRRFEEFAQYYLKLHPQGEEIQEKPAETIKVSEQSWEKLKPKSKDEKLAEVFMIWLKEQHAEIKKGDLAQDLTYSLNRIRGEIMLKLKGLDASNRAQLAGDQQVQRAIDAIKIGMHYEKK